MNVVILGPVTTASYFGGVAIFNEELAKGFFENGCSVSVFTLQKNSPKKIKDAIPVKYVTKRDQFCKLIEEDHIDFILASLGYAKLLPYKCTVPTAYFLHGFFNKSYYGGIKSLLAVTYQKLLMKKCRFIFANSYFTKMINRDFFAINTDAVFHPGVTNTLFEFSSRIDVNNKKTGQIFFCGRLVSAKGVRNLMEGVNILRQRNVSFELIIAGNGDEEQWMRDYAKENMLPVRFLGRQSQEEVAGYYAESEVFVSLNPSEPFGITFAEAVLCGCKIVCPKTGGQVEVLQQWPESVSFVDESDVSAVANEIERMLKHGSYPNLSCAERKAFLYSEVAAHMIRFLSGKIEK